MYDKKESPYTSFKRWLTDENQLDLPEDVLKAINLNSAIAMMGSIKGITEYINDEFNNFDKLNFIYKDKLEFFKYLKTLVLNNNINFYDFTFFNLKKTVFIDSYLKNMYPHLKEYEIELLINKVSTDGILNVNLKLMDNPKSGITSRKKKGKSDE